MIWVRRYLVLQLDIVDVLQDSEAVSHTNNAHLFQVIMLKCNQGFADDFIL